MLPTYFRNLLHRDIVHLSNAMRTTLNIDDDLLQRAQQLTGINEKTAIVRSGLEALIARERDAVVNGPEVDQVVADYLKNSHEFFDVRKPFSGYYFDRLLAA